MATADKAKVSRLSFIRRCKFGESGNQKPSRSGNLGQCVRLPLESMKGESVQSDAVREGNGSPGINRASWSFTEIGNVLNQPDPANEVACGFSPIARPKGILRASDKGEERDDGKTYRSEEERGT